MARKPVLSGGKKDELTEKALELFLVNGYENTSVRSILSAVNGEIGMFYHYFHYQDEIFEAAVDLYLANFVTQFTAIAQMDIFTDQIDSLLELFAHSSQGYVDMGAQNLHWSVSLALHQRTLNTMLPIVEDMVVKAVTRGQASNFLHLEPRDIAAFLVYGASGVLHQKPFAQLTKEEFLHKRTAVKSMVSSIIGVGE